jgi:glutathione synthase/RimK-type ligase-like ATP-grasp enzyme
MLVQELVAGNDFDTRVTIIGNRAFAWRRGNAPGDFRASGSGREDLDPAAIDPAAIRLAFRTARTLGMPTAAMDMLRREGEVVVTEVSYYFEPFMLRRCLGHWRSDGDALHWVEGPVQPEVAILDDFLERVAAGR